MKARRGEIRRLADEHRAARTQDVRNPASTNRDGDAANGSPILTKETNDDLP
jgi:hypothetical protein